MIYKMKKKSEINISIVILNFNSHEFTINCLKSIELSIDKYLEYEIIVVDNGSNINDFKLLNQKIEKNSYKLNIKVLRNKTNLGFGGGNMIGAKESIGKYIAFINNDTLKDISYDDGTGRHEYVVFSDVLRKKNIKQYLLNDNFYGILTWHLKEDELKKDLQGYWSWALSAFKIADDYFK